MTQYLHGVEVTEVADGPRPVQASGATVIGIVGTALDVPAGGSRIVLGPSEASEAYGSEGTIPAAIRAVHSQGRAPAIAVVNALDPAKHVTAVAKKEYTFDAAGEIQLDHRRLSEVVVTDDAAGTNTWADGADYTVDPAAGKLFRVAASANIGAGATVYVSYKWVDESTVTTDEVAAAAALLGEAETLEGARPDVLIAPGHSSAVTRTGQKVDGAPVTTALAAVADRIRAIVVADGPATNRQDAIDYRDSLASRRVFVVDPKVKVLAAGGAVAEAPASGYVAGLIARIDGEEGWWVSPSNREILGILGTSRFVSFGLGDKDAEANLLNASEVATIVRAKGFRLWGNRTCSDDPKWAFLSVVRTNDRINEAVLESHLWAVDRNITRTYVSDVVESVSAYLRDLVAQGAILGGRCWADPDLNPDSQVANGELYLDFDFTPSFPAERITFRSRLVGDYAETIF